MKPWEKYGAPAAAPQGRPWEKYAAPAPQAEKSPESWPDYLTGLAGEVTAGATFNFGDEMKAGIRTLTRGGTYADEKAQVDKEMADFEKGHPTASLAANFAGGAGLPGLGAASAGGKGLLAATAANAAIGAGTGAVAGAGTGNTLEERARGALAGGTLGTVLGGAAPTAARVVGGAVKAGKNILGMNDPGRTAEDLLNRSLRREGVTPDEGVDLVRIMQDNAGGAPVSVADIGPSTQRLARTVETVPSTGSRNLTEDLAGRQAGAAERVRQGVRSSVGSGAQNLTEDALRASREATAAPLYQNAFAAAPVHSDRIAEMVRDPIMQQGIRRGLEVQRLESLARNQPFNPSDYAITGFNDAGDPILGQVPNMRLLDAAKRGLDDILEGFREPVTGKMRLDQRGRAINEVRRSLLDELDTMNLDYKAARAAWAGPSASLDAVEAGRSFMRGDVEDVDSFFQRLTPGDRDFFRIGLSRELRDMVDKRPTALADATSRIMRPQVRQRLEQFLGADASGRLQDTLNVERQMSRTYKTATGGSQTGRIEAEQGDSNHTFGFFANLLRGNLTSAGASAMASALSRGRGINEGTADQLATMLTAWSPEDLKRLASRLNESELRRLASQARNKAVGRAALTGTLISVPAAMEDRNGR